MQEKLTAFFRHHEQLPWAPGEVDCCLFLAAWAIWLGHEDPAPHLRATYDTEDGFREIIRSGGGVVPVVEECVARIGGKRVQRPLCGSVGVIGSDRNIERQFGAIFDGESWRVRFINKIGTMTAKQLAIWSI